jgi:CheY-like chemotaxis protein
MARKLLLADDSITIQKVVELVLAEEDFDIRSVSNGEDALNLIESFQPEVVLADIEMPKVNGYQLCEKIKENPRTAGIPVILLAGAFEPIDTELAEKVGADDSVIKPFESQELISKLNAALTLSSPAESVFLDEALEQPGEEVLEFAEEEAIELEEAAEAVGVDEDLWALEEVSEAASSAEAFPEEGIGGADNAFELSEETLSPEPGEVPRTVLQADMRAAAVSVPEALMPSKEEFTSMIQKAVNDRVSDIVSSVDMKDLLLSSLMPPMKDSIEKILWEIAPDLVEKMMKEVMKSSVSALSAQVEKVIWETVPDLAGTMISSEIEKIKSEI